MTIDSLTLMRLSEKYVYADGDLLRKWGNWCYSA